MSLIPKIVRPSSNPLEKIHALTVFPRITRPVATENNRPNIASGVFTLGELYDRPATEVPKLLDPLIPRQGVVVLAGSSDTGKSSFLRQLGLAVAMGEGNFLGFPLLLTHRRAICVSTEDGDEAVGAILKMQLRGRDLPAEARDRLRFVFDTDSLPERLDKMLTQQPADLVVVDALGDLYTGNMNASNDVRAFVQQYSQLAQKHGCLVLFMHHTGKRTEDREPSKHNLLGSQGLEAKMRVAFELRADPYSSDLRHLCVLKGNYLPSEAKERSYVLRFNENLTFHNTGERATFGDLVKAPEENADEREFWAEAKRVLDEPTSFEKAAELLRPVAERLGVKAPSKSALARRFPKAIPPSHHPKPTVNGAVGYGMSDQKPTGLALSREEIACLFVNGNTTTDLLAELTAHHAEKGEAVALLTELRRLHAIEQSPSGPDNWRTPR